MKIFYQPRNRRGEPLPEDGRYALNERQRRRLTDGVYDVIEGLEPIAADKGCTTPQLALAWLLHQGDDIFPIPGAEERRYLEQNIAACDITLSDDELARIDAAVPRGAAAGGRMPEGEPTLAGSSD